MRSKTLYATLAAALLAAPLPALAQSDSCGDSAKLNCPQSTPTPVGPSAQSGSGDEQSAQGSSGDEQFGQSSSSGDDQVAQNDTDDSLTAEPSDIQSTSPYGSTGDPSTRNA